MQITEQLEIKTKKSNSSKTTKQVKKVVKKAAKKNPVAAIIILLVIVLAAGVAGYLLYSNGYLDGMLGIESYLRVNNATPLLLYALSYSYVWRAFMNIAEFFYSAIV